MFFLFFLLFLIFGYCDFIARESYSGKCSLGEDCCSSLLSVNFYERGKCFRTSESTWEYFNVNGDIVEHYTDCWRNVSCSRCDHVDRSVNLGDCQYFEETSGNYTFNETWKYSLQANIKKYNLPGSSNEDTNGFFLYYYFGQDVQTCLPDSNTFVQYSPSYGGCIAWNKYYCENGVVMKQGYDYSCTVKKPNPPSEQILCEGGTRYCCDEESCNEIISKSFRISINLMLMFVLVMFSVCFVN